MLLLLVTRAIRRPVASRCLATARKRGGKERERRRRGEVECDFLPLEGAINQFNRGSSVKSEE
jgi:hypothetical protein